MLPLQLALLLRALSNFSAVESSLCSGFCFGLTIWRIRNTGFANTALQKWPSGLESVHASAIGQEKAKSAPPILQQLSGYQLLQSWYPVRETSLSSTTVLLRVCFYLSESSHRKIHRIQLCSSIFIMSLPALQTQTFTKRPTWELAKVWDEGLRTECRRPVSTPQSHIQPSWLTC